jgi:hypothetical protein
MQPVLSEAIIRDNHIAWTGFPEIGDLEGIFQIDKRAGRMTITPAAEGGGAPPPSIEYPFALDGDRLTIGDGRRAVQLHRHRTIAAPLVAIDAELVFVDGIDDRGALVVKESTRLRGRSCSIHHEPRERTVTLAGAAILRIEDDDARQIGLDKARQLLTGLTAAVIVYRQPESPPIDSWRTLWKSVPPERVDGNAARQTYLRTLRPGTLVFVVAAEESAPQP